MKAFFRSAILAGAGALLLGLGLWPLHAGETSLKLAPAASAKPGQFTLKMQVQSTSNSVIYVIQTSTNLTQWVTLVSGRAKPGAVIQVANVSAANDAKFFRVNELPPGLVDTNPPAWSNGVGGQFTLTPPTGVTVGWNPAIDNVGVSTYSIFLNGLLVTNISAADLSYEFTLNYQTPADVRIQAADASGNLSPVMSLVYLPGNEIAAISDDAGHVYVFNYYLTNALVTNGGFAAARQIAYFGANDRGLALGDFDRDGILDLVAGYANGNTLDAYFFKGLGDGTFAAPVQLPNAVGAVQGSYVMGVAVGDWDGDGNLDVAINGNASTVAFYWGNGDGTFTPQVQDWADGSYYNGRGMASGDFNEDGLDDIARATCCNGMVKVLLSNGDRTFVQTNLVATGLGDNDPYAVAAGDFIGNGHLDLLVGGGGSGHVAFLQGNGDGTFTNLGANGSWTNLNIGTYFSLSAYDYSGDGNLDLVMAGYGTGKAFYWPGNGSTNFGTNYVTMASGVNNPLGAAAPPHSPRVDVNITPVNPVVNLNVPLTFTAVGAGVSANDTFRWSFGDTGTNPVAWMFSSASPNLGPTVTHTYTNEGHFLTRLRHTTTNGINSVRGTWVIAKGNPPVANAGGPYIYGSQVASQGVWYGTLNGSASTDDFGIISYAWNFGDGTSATNSAPTVFHGWPSNGVYAVSLTVMDAALQTSSANTTITFTNGAPPVAVITGPFTVGESNANDGTWTATFSGTDSTSPVGIWQYAWHNLTTGQTGNGSTFQTTWTRVGTNLLTLLVTANDSQTNSTTQTVVVVDDATPPVPVIQGPQLLSVAVATNGLWFGAWNATNSTSAAGIYVYAWAFGDGATASGTQVTHQYAASGVYSLMLTVTDNGNQSVTATQSVIVVAGNPPVARITASTLSPEGAQPISFSGDSSTSDHGIYLYTWFLPPRLFNFAGQSLDSKQWAFANAVQNNKLTVSNPNSQWGVSYFFSIGTELQRGCAIQVEVDTPSTPGAYAMVGLKDLNPAYGTYNQYPYALYFANGSIEIYEYGSYRGTFTNYVQGTAYDVQIATKPGAGANYYLRPSGTGQPFTLIYNSPYLTDATFSFGADVYNGVWSFENLQVTNVVSYGSDITTPVYPGGTVTLQVVDNANLTNSTSVVVSPVVGTPPVAAISGPTNSLAGVQLAFNGYGSSDDYGIASYTWNFGDGSPSSFGPAVAHSYGVPGTYTNTLTVMDYAFQTSSASLVVTIGGSNSLVHVPWLFVNNIEQPHPVYAGKTNTLKAVARGVPAPFTYIWNYGDGSGTVTNSVTNSAVYYDLQATHAYTGGDGTPYYAGITVILTNGTVYHDTYPLLIMTKTLNVEEEVAIDEGLWYVHKTITLYNIDTNTVGGYWSSIGTISATASSVQAFAVNGHLMTDDPTRDPYVDTVQRGVNYLLNNLLTEQIGLTANGNPDVAQTGFGLQVNSSYPIYEGGPVIDCFVATARPELIAPTGGANVKGRAFGDIVQDMVDMFAWGQYTDPTVGGGWRYGWNEGPDNSASQWGAIGMLGAETYWGTTIPTFVKPRNLVWVNYSMDSTGFGYTGPGSGAGLALAGEDACTPSALIQASFDGILNTNALWVHGENYLANNWSTLMADNNLYANYSIAKSLRTALPQPVQIFSATGLDWFNDPTIGEARVTINHQAADGSWTSSARVDVPISSAWSILILSSSLFQQGPVAVITAKPNPTAVGYPVVFDGSSSYDKLPNYKIVQWLWIFNAANGSDFSHPDATGPIVTNVYGAFSTNTVLLEVLDNHTPQLSSVASVAIDTTIPPYPPTADAGGPYVACAGEDVHLDGSGSFCVDASSGNFIQAYDWEVNYQVPLTFNQGVTGVHAVITNGYPVAGSYTIGLQVENANSIVYTNLALPNETAAAFTTVFVYNRLIADLKVRPKATKVQLTWTKAGDYDVIMRSSLGPDRGYAQVGQTTSTYATFLDTNIAYNTDYYYRIYAYQNGGAAPIGVSDAVFVHSLPRSFDEQPPSFVATPLRLAKVGQLYEETLDAVSPQNLPLYFSLVEGPTNMTVNATNGLVDFIPTAAQVGNLPLSFQVTNSVGRDVLSYTLFVFPASNPPPVVQINGPFTALTGQNIQFSSAGTTVPAGETLRYAWNFGDGSTSTNPNPVHAYGGVGNYLITLFVNNGYGITVSAQTRAVISRPDVPPVAVVSNAPSFTVRLGQTLTLNGSSSYSPLGNPITYHWFWGDGASTNNAPSVVSHLYAAGGPYLGSLVVTDNQGESNTNNFQVTMAPANQPPVIVLVVSTNSPFVQSAVTFDASQTYSPSGDPMTFTWSFGDQGKTTGPLVTHVYQQIGAFTATLTVADNYGGVSVATQQMNVLDAPPVFTSTPLLLTPTGTNYTYLPVVTDAAGAAVTFQLVQGPATMSCDTNSGLLGWLPGTGDLGQSQVDLRATDANGGSSDQSYTLVVTTPLGPVIDLLPTHMDVTNAVVDDEALTLSGTVRVYLSNNGTSPVPIPFTVSLFVNTTNTDFTGAFSTNTDEVVGYGVIPAGFPAGASAYVDMTVFGTNLFRDCPLYAYVDSQDVVPEYNKLNNILRSGSDLPTNTPPVIDLSASFLQVGRMQLPTSALLTARLGNSGLVSLATNVPLAFYDGDPTVGGKLIGVARSTLALDPGMYQDLSVAWASPTITNHNVFVVADDPGTGVYQHQEITYSNNTFSVLVNLAAILPPIANAGQNQNVNLGDTVSLNGSASSDPLGRPLTYQWSMLSIPIGSQARLTGTNTFNPSFVADVGGLFSAQLVVNDGLSSSTNPAVVYIASINTNTYYPPTITSTPSFQAIVSVLYKYQVTATDPQNKPLKFRLPQGPAGMIINTNTGLVQWTPTNPGNFFLQVAADGVGGSYFQGYTLTVIPFTNLPPQFTSTPVSTAAPNAAYGYTAVAVSPVNNSITYSLGQHPTGMSINGSSGAITWTPTAGQLGANSVAVVANDGHGGIATQSYSVVVLTTGANGPVVQTIPDQNVTAPATFATIKLDNYVSDPNYAANQIVWTVTGTNLLAVTIDSSRVATVLYPNGVNDSETITFLATDPAGNSGYSTPTFTVIGNAIPPVAAIANLSADTTTSISTGTFNLLGTADDPGVPGLVAYQIGLYDNNGNLVADVTPSPVDSGGWHEGRVPATGSLGSLDFTAVQNGSYTLYLTVQANGQTANASVQVAIDTPLKLGELTFGQQDLVLPVQGVGLQVNRTYDSFNPNFSSFGYSWSYSTSDLGVTVGDQRQETQDADDGSNFSLRVGGSWDVTLTMPDSGKTVTFKYSLDYGEFEASAVWTPPAWVQASLVPTCSSTLVTLPGIPPIWQAGGDETDYSAFDWPGFILTLQNGTQFYIAREDLGEHFYADDSGYGGFVQAYGTPYLSQITLPNGAQTDFIHDGTAAGLLNVVQHDPDGNEVKSLLFQRDGQNRISGIYTPEHLDTNGVPDGPASVAYSYDLNSNLASVIKLLDDSNPSHPLFATNRFLYTNPSFPHLLTEVIDARGIPVMQAVFDSLGRLIGTKDANGNMVSIQQNPSAQTTTTYDRLGNATTFSYDQNGNVISKTDPLGYTTTYTFSSDNRRTSMTDPLGYTSSYAYDANGNLNSVTDPMGHTTSMTISASGNPLSLTDPLGHTTANAFDASGNLTSSTDPLGNVTQLSHDTSGNLTSLVDPSGHTTAQVAFSTTGVPSQIANVAGQAMNITYDASGHATSHQTQWVNPANSNDVRTVTSYVGVDYAGRITNSVDAMGNSYTRVYDSVNNLIQTTDLRGNTMTNTYDADGNLIESQDSNGLDTRTVYDANNREVLQVDAHLAGQNADGTQLIYDADGRLVSKVRLSNVNIAISPATLGGVTVLESSFVSAGGVISSNSTVYDADGRRIAYTDEAGNTTHYQYDAAGNNTAIIDPLGNQTTLTYDADDKNIGIQDALGNETYFLYDAGGHRVQTVYPSGAASSQTFNAAGQLATATDPLGHVRTTTYDNLGVGNGIMLPRIADPENGNNLTNPFSQVVFDVNRNVQTVIDPKSRVTSFTYDQFNHRISRTLPLGQVEQTAYDSAGDISRITDFDGQATAFQYDNLGRVITRSLYAAGSGSPAQSATMQYDALGRIVQLNEPRGVTTYAYDLENRTTQIAAPEGTINYVYDPVTGWKTRTYTANSDTRYAYDALGRLQTVTAVERNGQVLSVPGVTTYTYDAVGDRASVTLPNGIQTLYTYDKMSRLAAMQQVASNGVVLMSFAYQYDAANQRTNGLEIITGPDGSVHTNHTAYAYDALNRLVQETATDMGNGSGYQAGYVYDLVGNRLSRSVTTAGKSLTTYYAYDANDRLLMESNVVVAAGSGGGMIRPSIMGPDGRPVQLNDPLFAKANYYALKALPGALFAAFLLPAALSLLRRGRRPAVLTLDLNPHRALLPRCVTGVLVVLMLLLGFDLRVMANQATYYAALTTDTWGLNGSVTTYQYDANGSITKKTITGPNAETDTFQYTLMKQLAALTRSYTSSGSQVVETTSNNYNFDGIRVSTMTAIAINGAPQSATTNYFLIDPQNRTGWAQVLEESPAIGATPTTSYTIGDDLIAQSTSPSGAAQYLLRDGHDSTRQLASNLGVITDYYGYDAYGIMLGGNPTTANPSDTQMLYGGGQFDANLGLYNLRSRFYDTGTGRFTTMDSYEGSPRDPQSLHKYAYCADNPVNYLDPGGHQDLVETIALVGILGTIIGISIGASHAWLGGSFSPDSTMFGVGLSVSGSGYGAIGVTVANFLSQAAFQASDDPAGKQVVGDILGAVGGSVGNAARNLGLGASVNVGAESLYTTGDQAISAWTYYGPGIGYSSGSGPNGVSGSVTFYGGVCWNVPTWRDYAGPFVSLSLGAGAAVFGWAVSFFWSDGNAAQNGYNVGLSIGVSLPPGASSNWGFSGGVSYVTYHGSYAGSWDQASYILTVLALVPGMQIWVPFLGYKWGMEQS